MVGNALIRDERDVAAIEPAVQEAGGGEAGYEAGVRVKNQIRMEQERGS